VERNIKLVLEYDGAGLAGWQRQKDRPTVQEHLERALSRLTGEKIVVVGAGRTDAGVHARGQAAHFKTNSRLSPLEIQRGGNALLPPHLAILSAAEAPPDWHARFSAKSKVYEYSLYVSPVRSSLKRLYAWHIPYKIDLEAMREALECLMGEHDFASFRSTGSETASTVRNILEADIIPEPDGLVRIRLKGDGFLRHMVRAIVGTLVEVGGGKISPAEFKNILESRDRSLAGPTAPAHGLCLVEVVY